MQKKRPKTKADGLSVLPEGEDIPLSLSAGLWVRPNMNLRHEREADRDMSPTTSGNTQKFLELANIALGFNKPATAMKKARSVLASATLRKGKRSLQKN